MDEPGYFVECGDTMPNKLGISDAKELELIEYDRTAENTREILASAHPTKFDFDLLLDLHRQLFGDIYDFAGKVRTILHADTQAFAGNLQPLRDLYRQIVFKISEL